MWCSSSTRNYSCMTLIPLWNVQLNAILTSLGTEYKPCGGSLANVWWSCVVYRFAELEWTTTATVKIIELSNRGVHVMTKGVNLLIHFTSEI